MDRGKRLEWGRGMPRIPEQRLLKIIVNREACLAWTHSGSSCQGAFIQGLYEQVKNAVAGRSVLVYLQILGHKQTSKGECSSSSV